MHLRRSTAAHRFIRHCTRFFGIALVGLALSAPAVQAAAPAPHKKTATVKKKHTASATPAKSKRPAAAQETAPKTKAKTARQPASKTTAATRVHRTLAARAVKAPVRALADVPERKSFGQAAGLHAVNDPLDLKSSVALVLDQDTHEVLLSKNDHAVLPIASLTKLMTGLLVVQARLPLDEPITITQDDVDTEKGSHSRLAVGTTLSRGEMLHLALMSSENRAAHALGRTYPGGLDAFVALMNAKARQLGMTSTRYVEPTGLSSSNQSSARDLAVLVNTAYAEPLMRELTTSPGYEVAVGNRTLQYNNTNRLVKNPDWDIGLQKTGYISEAGRCLVMQTKIAGRRLIMVFLDSAGKLSRIADAQRVRHWVESASAATGNPALGAKLQSDRSNKNS
ncbi:D-alanyl-D-alanine endopeptidase [Extensimonas vulgaris]|uniref:Murein-DD-endopeptidase n=1 Tax=Extensimonas vulgaris TaxID=1031594 RepID=A0A369AJ75_9BURK|nr:D-alanyl-D-alanine endopeptidase [Extensimonas vulgaris]RCX08197.1 murein-DD-endopeptidase [Extensimonas vulgaris]TWI37530.1 murein-DD-endopeptidase [Extensimonas vulgaris]TXD13790.1 D-alanyl-D-alanine endopeptidase [Extensimonas vulgaris]